MSTQVDIHSGIVQNIQKVERTQMLFQWSIDKQNVVYPYTNRILLGYKEKWNTGICNKDESWKYAKWKNSVRNDNILYFYLYEMFRTSKSIKTIY